MVVRYDPRDISMIWVELDDGRYVEARYRNLEIPPVSLWEYRETMRKARALGKSGSNELVLAELIRQQRQIEAESRGLTKAERRCTQPSGGVGDMTQDWLVLDLCAPLMAFGGVAIDQVGPVRDFPALSMVVGLFGNALGWDWSDRTAHEALQDRIVMASAIAREGRRLTDSQNAQLSKLDRGWTTRGKVEERAGASYSAPHRRLRDYHADGAVVIVLRLDPAPAAPDLAMLAAALERPARPLFFGRKPCLPGRPILRPGRIAADTGFAALQAVAETGDSTLPQLPAHARAQWTPDQGPDGHAMALADIRVWTSGMHGGTRRVVEERLGCEVPT